MYILSMLTQTNTNISLGFCCTLTTKNECWASCYFYFNPPTDFSVKFNRSLFIFVCQFILFVHVSLCVFLFSFTLSVSLSSHTLSIFLSMCRLVIFVFVVVASLHFIQFFFARWNFFVSCKQKLIVGKFHSIFNFILSFIFLRYLFAYSFPLFLYTHTLSHSLTENGTLSYFFDSRQGGKPTEANRFSTIQQPNIFFAHTHTHTQTHFHDMLIE